MVQIGDMTRPDEATNSPVAVSNQTTHDISVNGTTAVTGIGFKPVRVDIYANTSGSDISWGHMNAGGTQFNMANNHLETANTWQLARSRVARCIISSGNESSAAFTSMDSDGFTITWTKAGSPTGTITVGYIAYKTLS